MLTHNIFFKKCDLAFLGVKIFFTIMKKLILYHKSGYNVQTNMGAITIYLEDKSTKDFLNLTLEQFTALLLVLNQSSVYWDGTWVQAG